MVEIISSAVLQEWKRQADEAGDLDEYTYHLGMINPPLPYGMWKLKKVALDRIQARPDYESGAELPLGIATRHDQLIKELGY